MLWAVKTHVSLKHIQVAQIQQVFAFNENTLAAVVWRSDPTLVLLCGSAAMLDREFMLSRDRERKLQRDLEAAAARLGRQEQLNMELRVKNEQLVSRVRQQQVNRQEITCVSVQTQIRS